jgi:hypothetical protein
MFNLNTAIESWRQALATGDICTVDELDELESHLREQIDNMRAAGLSEEEAFIVARRRLGDTDRLRTEFAKLDPFAAWRRRLSWMILGAVVWVMAWPLYQPSWRAITLLIYRLPTSPAVLVPAAVAIHLLLLGTMFLVFVWMHRAVRLKTWTALVRWFDHRGPISLGLMIIASGVLSVMFSSAAVFLATTAIGGAGYPGMALVEMNASIRLYEAALRTVVLLGAATAVWRLGRPSRTGLQRRSV